MNKKGGLGIINDLQRGFPHFIKFIKSQRVDIPNLVMDRSPFLG